jgi:hypothetical protein
LGCRIVCDNAGNCTDPENSEQCGDTKPSELEGWITRTGGIPGSISAMTPVLPSLICSTPVLLRRRNLTRSAIAGATWRLSIRTHSFRGCSGLARSYNSLSEMLSPAARCCLRVCHSLHFRGPPTWRVDLGRLPQFVSANVTKERYIDGRPSQEKLPKSCQKGVTGGISGDSAELHRSR